MNTREDQTPPAPDARPTQDVKRMGDVTICRNGYVEDIERQIAESKENEASMRRIAAACQCPSKDADIAILKGQLAERTAECEEQARLLAMSSEREARLIAERDALVETCQWAQRELGIPGHHNILNALAAVKGGSHE